MFVSIFVTGDMVIEHMGLIRQNENMICIVPEFVIENGYYEYNKINI